MSITDDVRKTFTDPTPLYAVAGTADLALEKLREVPALVDKLREEAPDRIAAVRSTDPRDVQDRVGKQAKDAQARVAERLGALDTDIKRLRETAQGLALQGVGRAAEYAVKARETYDELAERGRGAVKEWRGEAAEQVEVTAEFVRPEAGAEVKLEPEPEADAAAAAADEPQAEAKKSASRKSTAKKTAPRKTTAKKTEPGPGS